MKKTRALIAAEKAYNDMIKQGKNFKGSTVVVYGRLRDAEEDAGIEQFGVGGGKEQAWELIHSGHGVDWHPDYRDSNPTMMEVLSAAREYFGDKYSTYQLDDIAREVLINLNDERMYGHDWSGANDVEENPTAGDKASATAHVWTKIMDAHTDFYGLQDYMSNWPHLTKALHHVNEAKKEIDAALNIVAKLYGKEKDDSPPFPAKNPESSDVMPPTLDTIRDVLANKSAVKLKWPGDNKKILLDMTTANLLMTVYSALSTDAGRAKFTAMLTTRASFVRLVNKAWSWVK